MRTVEFVAQKIDAATTLHELRAAIEEALQHIGDRLQLGDVRAFLGDYCDPTSLRHFGGEDPQDQDGMLSWDEREILWSDGLRLQPRVICDAVCIDCQNPMYRVVTVDGHVEHGGLLVQPWDERLPVDRAYSVHDSDVCQACLDEALANMYW